jgi:hypothetical protein
MGIIPWNHLMTLILLLLGSESGLMLAMLLPMGVQEL